GVTRVNGGKLTSSVALAIQGGTLMGVDAAAPPTISAPISNTSGIVHPGLSPGILSTSGAFTQGAAGSFNVDLNGTTVGTGFSQLNVAGAVTIGGTLNISLGAGFTPAVGNTFTILTCSGSATCLTGTFGTTNFPSVPGLTLTPTYTANSVVVNAGTATGPDLSITKTASVATTHLSGGNFTYTLTPNTTQPLPPQHTALSPAPAFPTPAPLPANAPFFFVPPPGACAAPPPLPCAIGNLATGATPVITVPVIPAAIAPATNTATITANETDSNP